MKDTILTLLENEHVILCLALFANILIIVLFDGLCSLISFCVDWFRDMKQKKINFSQCKQ